MQVASSEGSEEKTTTDSASKDLTLQLNNSDEGQNKTYVDDDDEKDAEESKNGAAMRVEDQELNRSSNQTNLHDSAPAEGSIS